MPGVGSSLLTGELQQRCCVQRWLELQFRFGRVRQDLVRRTDPKYTERSKQGQQGMLPPLKDCFEDAYCFLLSSFSGDSQPGAVFPACQGLSAMGLGSTVFTAEEPLCHLMSFSGRRKLRGSAALCTSRGLEKIWISGEIPKGSYHLCSPVCKSTRLVGQGGLALPGRGGGSPKAASPWRWVIHPVPFCPMNQREARPQNSCAPEREAPAAHKRWLLRRAACAFGKVSDGHGAVRLLLQHSASWLVSFSCSFLLNGCTAPRDISKQTESFQTTAAVPFELKVLTGFQVTPVATPSEGRFGR